MFANSEFKNIFRISTLFVVVLAALAFASLAQAQGRNPDPYCNIHGNVYFWSQVASEDYIDEAVGSDDWVIGGHYLIGQQTLDNGYILQFWIHIMGHGLQGKYEIEEYFFMPICDNEFTYTPFDDLLFNPFVNPVLEEVEVSRSTVLTLGEEPIIDLELPEVKEDDGDDAHPPEPGQTSAPPEVTDDSGSDDDGGVIIVASEAPGDIILIPFPTIP